MGAGAKSISATRHVALHGHRHHRIVVHARVVILDGNDGALVTRIQRTNLRSAAVREEGGAKREAHGHDEDPTHDIQHLLVPHESKQSAGKGSGEPLSLLPARAIAWPLREVRSAPFR